jgi:RNA polymerase sigma-70 factor, ECF subfamily
MNINDTINDTDKITTTSTIISQPCETAVPANDRAIEIEGGPMRAEQVAIAMNPTGLPAEVVLQLWRSYRQDGSESARDRLVEYYTPWFQKEAAGGARRMGMLDIDNAVGEALFALVAKIMPSYRPRGDGTPRFKSWAQSCLRRKLIDLRRRERKDAPKLLRGMHSFVMEPEDLPFEKEPDETHFAELVAPLNDREAVVLWLRYFRGLAPRAIAAVLNVPVGTVKSRTHYALIELRERIEASSSFR